MIYYRKTLFGRGPKLTAVHGQAKKVLPNLFFTVTTVSDESLAHFGRDPLTHCHCSKNDNQQHGDLRPGEGVE